MTKIQVMSTDLANKIAAGEVVEKTMNVVKELVENSIDAKASKIDVFVVDGGRTLIEIKDNEKEIEDRFYKELEFGTAGLRGVIGAGTNRMNKYTVR